MLDMGTLRRTRSQYITGTTRSQAARGIDSNSAAAIHRERQYQHLNMTNVNILYTQPSYFLLTALIPYSSRETPASTTVRMRAEAEKERLELAALGVVLLRPGM